MNEELSIQVGTKADGDCPTPYILMLSSGSIKYVGHFSVFNAIAPCNLHAVIRWKLSATSSEEFSALLGIVNNSHGLTGNKLNLQSMQIHSSSSSEHMSCSDPGKRPQEM